MSFKGLLDRVTKGRVWAVPLALALAIGFAQPAFGSSDLIAAGSSPQIVQPGAETQTSVGGQVTITATWQDPSAGPTFTVVLDTHAVNLDAFDLAQLAVLRTDQGLEVRPVGWDAPLGGHHREGTLSFPEITADGSPVVGPSTRLIELVIRDVDAPERVLQWLLM